MVDTARVLQISTEDIEPNPHNPRRLFDEEPMQILKESVQKLGILVPVTVYQSTKVRPSGAAHYVLLDGERRWRCAGDLHIERIPAIVIEEPTETQNILTMFHIHNVREGWQLMPTALKLEVLIRQLKESNERKLAELTKLSISQVRRCKILLSYPKRFQNMMLAPPSERMKADFFIELDRVRRPALTDGFAPWVDRGDAKTVSMLLEKYESKVIVAVTDFRRLAEIYRAAHERGMQRRFAAEFNKFLDHSDRKIDDINVPGATFAKEAKELHRSARRLVSQLEATNIEAIAADASLLKTLKRLEKVLQKKLESGLLIEVRDAKEAEDQD